MGGARFTFDLAPSSNGLDTCCYQKRSDVTENISNITQKGQNDNRNA